jgi:hypothetical protein
MSPPWRSGTLADLTGRVPEDPPRGPSLLVLTQPCAGSTRGDALSSCSSAVPWRVATARATICASPARLVAFGTILAFPLAACGAEGVGSSPDASAVKNESTSSASDTGPSTPAEPGSPSASDAGSTLPAEASTASPSDAGLPGFPDASLAPAAPDAGSGAPPDAGLEVSTDARAEAPSDAGPEGLGEAGLRTVPDASPGPPSDAGLPLPSDASAGALDGSHEVGPCVSQGDVTFRMQVATGDDAGYSYVFSDVPAVTSLPIVVPGKADWWYSVATADGTPARIFLSPSVTCDPCEIVGNLPVGTTTCAPLPIGGVTATWNGMAVTGDSTCKPPSGVSVIPGPVSCQVTGCMPAGSYVVTMCARALDDCQTAVQGAPCADLTDGCLASTHAPICVSVPFQYPSTADVVGTLPP